VILPLIVTGAFERVSLFLACWEWICVLMV